MLVSLALVASGRVSINMVTGMSLEVLEANVEWGELFLDKYSAGNAEQSFDEVLKIDRNHPDGLAGMAKVKLVQRYDLAAATKLIGRALKANPKHIPSLLVRGGLEIDQNKFAVDATHLGMVA